MFRSLLILASALLFLTACKEKPEIPRQELEELIDSGLKKKARERIAGLFKIQNLKNSTPLSIVENPRRLIRAGLDGNTIAWVEDRFLFYWLDKNFEKMELDEFVPAGLALSRGGRFALLTRRTKDKECRLHPVSLRKKEIIDIDLKADCGHTPAISDDGALIYYTRGGRLHYRRLKPTQIGQLHSREFKSRYKKIQAYFHAKDLPGEGLFIFHGAAGYYKGFSMSSISAGVRYLGKGFSAPELYGTGLTPDFIAEFTRKQDADPSAPDDGSQTPRSNAKPKEDAPSGKQTAKKDDAGILSYLYAGGAARHKLHSYQNGASKTKVLRPMAYSPSLIYLRDIKQFLLLRKGQLHLMSDKGRFTPLPLPAKRFFVFQKGLVFEDDAHRLYFRRSAFTPNERLLLDLQERAR